MKRAIPFLVLILFGFMLISAPAQKARERTDAEKKAIEQIKARGGLVLELAQNDPRLEVSYHLSGKPIAVEDLTPLKDLPDLVHLNLRGKEVTDDMLVHLKDLKSLVRLHLERTKITDAGLAHLKGLANLEYLNLYGTEVTDKGLAHLEPLKKLKKLYVWQTKITEPEAEKLEKAIEGLEVVHGIEVTVPPPMGKTDGKTDDEGKKKAKKAKKAKENTNK
jgi:hypothetical protein